MAKWNDAKMDALFSSGPRIEARGRVWVRAVQPSIEGQTGSIPVNYIHGPFEDFGSAVDWIEHACGVDKGGRIPEGQYAIEEWDDD